MTRPVSVIVPHYRDLAGLEICLAALARQTGPPSPALSPAARG